MITYPPIIGGLDPQSFQICRGWSLGDGKRSVQEGERVKGVKKPPPAAPRRGERSRSPCRGGYHPPENLI